MAIEIINSDAIPRDLWRQFTVSDLEDEIRVRFRQLYNREPDHIYEVHLGNNTIILAGPVRPEEKIKKGVNNND
jgi:hypothetical protein